MNHTRINQAIISILAKELDTRDKRFMFLRLSFPKAIACINLEGSSMTAAWAINSYFENQGDDHYKVFAQSVVNAFDQVENS